MPMSRLTIKERVANGARWLDENFPGWEDRINPETLDMENGQRCICGQVFVEKERTKPVGPAKKDGLGDYYDGYSYAQRTLFGEANSWISAMVPMDDRLGIRAPKVAEALGFYDDSGHYVGLTREWKRLLRERKAALTVSPSSGKM